MGDLLVVEGLTKVYATRRTRLVAIDNVELRVGVGEVVGLLGPNGAGKTTTIKCICGLVTPTDGTVVVDGIDARKHRRSALGRLAAVLEGNRTIYWRLSVRENLAFFAALRGIPVKRVRREIDACIEQFGLSDKADVPAMKLSRGMQQKVAVAAAVVADVPLLLLDEPTLGLDVETSHELRHHLRALAHGSGRGVVISSHDMGVVRDVCDRVVIVNHGRVVVDDLVDNLLAVFRARTFRVTVRAPVPGGLVEALRGRFGLVQVDDQSEWSDLTVGLRGPDELYALIDVLRSASLVIESIERVEPDLEEVFLRLVRGDTERTPQEEPLA